MCPETQVYVKHRKQNWRKETCVQHMAKAGEVERKWYVDATDVPLGRLSAVVASVLRGKKTNIHTTCGYWRFRNRN